MSKEAYEKEQTLYTLKALLLAEQAIEKQLHPSDYWDANTAQQIRIDAIKRAIEEVS